MNNTTDDDLAPRRDHESNAEFARRMRRAADVGGALDTARRGGGWSVADSMVDLQVAACDLRAERDEARERWTDLRERLQRAESVLTQNGKYDTGMRLQGKAQGVALALSYMGDAERIAASQSANPDPPTGVANPTGAERRGSRRPRWDPTAHVWLALSIARLDALIAEWRAAADDFASRND